MKALYITNPGRTEIRDIPVPVPKDDEALLQVKMVGFCGSDLNTYRGRNPMVTLPRIPGHEVAAEVGAVGKGVPASIKPGMPVTVSPYTNCGACPSCRRARPNACQFNQTMGVQRDGAMTEYVCVPWGRLYHSPKLSLKELAIVEPLTVGFHAAARGEIKPGDKAVVFGCGAIGLGAVAGAAWRGAETIAVDIDAAKLEVARQVGAAHVINSSKQDIHAALTELTRDGPDVVIEAIGLPATFRAAVEEVAFSGRVVYIGYAKEPVAYETKLFVQKELDIRGSRNALNDFTDVIAMLERGQFPAAALISSVVSLAHAGEALEAWSRDPGQVRKILVDMSA
ncbi:MAG: zinc-binding alcohol dehydrogenase family protein [Kiritimatiellae bacterium]|nr:zinc-binding alcohol dehydrogenase family protein [Kiritimatiellia bacterium]